MAKLLTARQADVLDYIMDYVQEYGYGPTLREIRLHFGIASLRGASVHLDALEKKGYVQRPSLKNGPRASREIMILASALRLHAKSAIEDKPLPCLGAAGLTLAESLQNHGCGSLMVPLTALIDSAPGDHFLARVPDHSMTGANIDKGDFVVARAHGAAQSGDIVVAGVGGTLYIRRYHNDYHRHELHAMSPNYAPVTFYVDKGDAIFGKVVGVMRGFEPKDNDVK